MAAIPLDLDIYIWHAIATSISQVATRYCDVAVQVRQYIKMPNCLGKIHVRRGHLPRKKTVLIRVAVLWKPGAECPEDVCAKRNLFTYLFISHLLISQSEQMRN